MSFGSFLFGKSGKSTLRKESTLLPEQLTGLKGNLDYFNSLSKDDLFGLQNYEGDVAAKDNTLQGMSLTALEQVAMNMADPNGPNALAKEQLSSFLRGEKTGDSSFEDFFTKSIQEPALRNFEESVLPRTGRSYGGSNFFGSERGFADNKAREDLIRSLTEQRATGKYQERQTDIDTMLKAIGLSSSVDGADASTLSTLLEGSLAAKESDQVGLDKLFQKYLVEQQLRGNRQNAYSGAIGTQAFENILINRPPQTGLVTGLLNSAAEGFGQAFGKAKGGG